MRSHQSFISCFSSALSAGSSRSALSALATTVLAGLAALTVSACGKTDAPAGEPASATAPPAAALPAAPGAAPEAAPPGAAAAPLRPTARPATARPAARTPEAPPAAPEGRKPANPPAASAKTTVPAPVVTIENAKALGPFFEALNKTEQKLGTTRISHYGASVLGSDGPTSVTRHALWKHFGNAGKGWVNVAPGWKWYRPQDISFKPANWKSRTVVNHKLKDGRYGFGGVAAIGGKGSRTRYSVDADRMELWYKASPKSGEVTVTIDGKAQTFSIAGEQEGDAWKSFDLPPLADGEKHEVVVEGAGNGPVRLYGVVFERGGHGVVYDTIPLIGARGSRLLKYDETHIKAQVAQRRPDLLIANFGGNELVDKNMNLSVYERQYRTAMQRLFAGVPRGACLVMGPTDHATTEDGRPRPDTQLPKVIAIQKKLAKELGCGFYDSTAATGGLGISIRTQRTKKPLYYTDYAHLTPEGNKVLGTETYRALMHAYEQWKSAR